MSERTAGVLSVMMPVYNEERTLAQIVRLVLARPEVGQLVAVDDCSADASWSILQDLAAADGRVVALRQERNAGKGAAIRRAIPHLSKPFAIVQDADLELDPSDYASLLAPLVEGRAEVVFGARTFAARNLRERLFVGGNRALTGITNLLFSAHIHDMETCYKVLPSDLWKRLDLRGSRFEIEPEITARVRLLGHRITEVPIRYSARGQLEGKKLAWTDGLQAVRTLLRLRLAGRRGLFPGQR